MACLFLIATDTSFAAKLPVEVEVAPLASDSWITDRVKLALLLDDRIGDAEVHVDTNRGRVTLYGSVATQQAKNRAEELAGEIRGVEEVRTDLLQVVPPGKREAIAISDQSIRRRVEWTLRDDPHLLDSEIAVESVTNGVVVLGGVAASQSDLLRALRRAAEVQGVDRVASVIDLDAIPGNAKAIPPEDTWPRTAPDHWITSAVKMRLMATPDIPALDISVDTDDRQVTLFGIVATAEQRQRAEMAALRVNAVRRVDNQLVVVPESAEPPPDLSDEQIRDGVRTALALEPGLLDAKIEVTVVEGIVELAGTTETDLDRTTAVREARGIDGVRAVIDKIRVPDDGMRAPAPHSVLWPMRPVLAKGSLQ